MKFESVKCDQCQRIQDQANHWLKIVYWEDSIGKVAVAMGDLSHVLLHRGVEPAHLDLCGQACAIKHLGKLLGWSAPTEGA
jgi:hypothetical protein